MATSTTQPKASARERLLTSANELFYREGVHSVGIDRVIEHAGVAKASLYKSFGSKEELVHAYLLSRQANTTARVTAAIDAQTTPRAKLLAVFDTQAEIQGRPGFRGCAFSAASAESKPGGLVEEATHGYRDWFRTLFTELATSAGADDPAMLGSPAAPAVRRRRLGRLPRPRPLRGEDGPGRRGGTHRRRRWGCPLGSRAWPTLHSGTPPPRPSETCPPSATRHLRSRSSTPTWRSSAPATCRAAPC